jgi:hypothetical protein
MSRGLDDDARGDIADRSPDRHVDDRDRASTRADEVLTRGLALPRGEAREIVECRGREYQLNGSEAGVLATVGAFRVVATADLGQDRHGHDPWHGDFRALRDQGLLAYDTLIDRHGTQHVISLTREGKALLDDHAVRHDGRAQTYYAEAVKPRELAHDARLYAAFRAEADRIERDGGRVTRIVLDHELKRDYQQYLNRDDREDHTDLEADRAAFAAAHHLRVVDDHLALPDLRIEYETDEGRLAYRDVEIVTEHYSRGQLDGKARAGFTCYRAAGARGGGSRTGGTPRDPRHLERLT